LAAGGIVPLPSEEWAINTYLIDAWMLMLMLLLVDEDAAEWDADAN